MTTTDTNLRVQATRVMEAQQTEPTVHSMETEDGTRLVYRAWLPERPTSRALIVLHRGHEHSGRVQDVVEALGLTDLAVFAWDARGHGRSGGARGYAPGFGRLVEDLDLFARHVCDRHAVTLEDTVVLAHSVGGVIATTWVHDHAPPIRGLVLATPAFRVRLYVPGAIPGLRLLQRLRGSARSFVTSYVKSRMLTHDPVQARRYDEDPLIERGIAVNVLLGMHDTARRVVADAGAIRVPTLLLSGGSDWVVSLRTQRRFFERLGASDKRMQVFDGMYHDILHESERHRVLDEIRDFVRELHAQPTPSAPLLAADRLGPGHDEYARLAAPPPALHPKSIGYGLLSLGMRTVGKLSRGIRLGQSTGFDSGETLGYVYDDVAHGALGLGKLIDRVYLDSVGWRGIRERRVHLEEMLRRAIRDSVDGGGRAQILDVATGTGSYVLETLRSMPDVPVDAILRDNEEANLAAGRRSARQLGLTNVHFEQGDAFDPVSIASVRPRPDIAIVSGLYELFPDNDRVLESLRGLARALRATAAATGRDAVLLYTGQPWHPQLELIARVLVNREGKPWVMRLRSQAELDDLVRAAGFTKHVTKIGEQGIFTVSRATIGSGTGG